MARNKRTRREGACVEASCPALSGEAGSVGSGAPRACECGRNAELGAILASTLDPVITIDSFGMVRSASDSVERVLGWKPEDLIGRNVSVLMPEPHRSAHDQYLSNYQTTLKTNILGRTREFEAERRDGTRFPIELSVSRADVPGMALPIFVGIIKDTSERKAIDSELQRHRQHLNTLVLERTHELEQSHEQLRMADRLAAIGTLAAGLGHDMNNVLLPVRARLNALESMTLPKAASAHLVQMRKACEYLQQLTDGLHMLALNAEENDTHNASTDLLQWWTTVGPLLTKAVPKGVRFEVSLAKRLPRVPVAPHKLTQAVLNLIVNAGEAIQSMPKRPRNAVVRLTVHPSPGGGDVHLGIGDNGPGMTREVRARAFDAFYSTKSRGMGTGLGLSLVRSVVMNAGGEIDIETSPGKGLEVVLTLPAIDQHEHDGWAGEAAVFVLDRRAASMAAHILESDGWHVTRTDVPRPPLSSRRAIWVTEPCQEALRAAKAFLAHDGRAVVTVGEPHRREPWTKLGALPVENPRDFDSLRDAIARAVAVAVGAPR